MKEITLWECEYCGKRFESKEECVNCETSHGNLLKANNMLRDGKSLYEINEVCGVWDSLPDEIADLTITKAYSKNNIKIRNGAGRVVVAINEDRKLVTSKVGKTLHGTNSYTIEDFANSLKHNPEESEYMEFLYSKYGKEMVENITIGR